MQDLARTYLANRFIMMLDGEYAAIFAIVNKLIFFLMWSSGIIQIFETMDKEDWTVHEDHEKFHNIGFFMLTSMSVIGYGSSYQSHWT